MEREINRIKKKEWKERCNGIVYKNENRGKRKEKIDERGVKNKKKVK